jgi:hypothetical protein
MIEYIKDNDGIYLEDIPSPNLIKIKEIDTGKYIKEYYQTEQEHIQQLINNFESSNKIEDSFLYKEVEITLCKYEEYVIVFSYIEKEEIVLLVVTSWEQVSYIIGRFIKERKLLTGCIDVSNVNLRDVIHFFFKGNIKYMGISICLDRYGENKAKLLLK